METAVQEEQDTVSKGGAFVVVLKHTSERHSDERPLYDGFQGRGGRVRKYH